MNNSELTATPPPAYGSTYAFPAHEDNSDQDLAGSGSLNDIRDVLDLDGSPLPLSQDGRATMRRVPPPVSWSRSRGRSGHALGADETSRCSPGLEMEEEAAVAGEDLQWMNDRSREELQELLMKAHEIIKERESGQKAFFAACVCRLFD